MRILLFVLAIASLFFANADKYLIGSGIADITGVAAEIGFMGYAVTSQKGTGIHMRQRSRAFIVADPNNPNERVVYVSIDFCMGFQMVSYGVADMLKATYGDLYTAKNVIISGTHTHGTPGGVGGTALVDITTFGFYQDNYDAVVTGIYNSIVRAHENMKVGTITYTQGELYGANANRSPASYLRDPLSERNKYADNTDKTMTVLKFTQLDGNGGPKEIGMISFFAVHLTSMNNTNTLVTPDNKGFASLLFENMKNPNDLPGHGDFVAAFGQSNLGDVSPNTKGATCPDGTPCDFVHSTCGGKVETCIASGPGRDMYESTEIIGRLQFEKAYQLYQKADIEVSGPIASVQQYNDMQSQIVDPQFSSTGKQERTCIAALGYAFAAGTTDGPGDFNFIEGTNSTNPFWAWVSSFLAKPTEDQIACQQPKPILLDVGLIEPIEWVPFILPQSIFRIGQVYIIGFPGEATTMSGRRLRETVKQSLIAAGAWTEDSIVVIAGLSNSYSHYITTFEEFQEQRYEGASTLYGPHTLAAHQQIYSKLATALVTGENVPQVDPLPMDMRNHTFSFIPPHIEDTLPAGVPSYGSIASDVPKSNYVSGEVVSVSFWGGSPRNTQLLEQTFLTVELLVGSTWQVVFTDSHWETKFKWEKVEKTQSKLTIEWAIPTASSDTKVVSGTYRIRHFGVSKTRLGVKTPYSGTSSTFTVDASKKLKTFW